MPDTLTHNSRTVEFPEIFVPTEESFNGEDFQTAPDLERLTSRLIGKPDSRFAFLSGVRLSIVWKRKGGKYRGSAVMGKAQKASGLAKYWGETDFIVWLAADHLKNRTADFIGNVLYHELLHIGVEPDKGIPILVPHDVEMFLAEVTDLGLWRAELEQAADVFRQMKLPFEDAAD